METLYDILEVSRKASKEVIEKAYKTLAKKYHPDLQAPENKEYAEKRMKQINEAYDILSSDEKRREYDQKLEAQEAQNYNESTEYSQNINNTNTNTSYNMNNEQTNENINFNNEENWKIKFSDLSPSEQRKIKMKIEKEAREEYRKQYIQYFKSLGFKIKHKWTFKDFLVIILVICILAIIIEVLWVIPQTHEWLLGIYNENFFIKLVIDIFIGIFKGVLRFFENITKF